MKSDITFFKKIAISFNTTTIKSLQRSRGIYLLLMVLFFSITPMVSFGQTETFTSSGTFTVPAGVNSITVQVWGAGGAGGGSSSSSSPGSGGGGGGYTTATFSVNSGQKIVYVVGTAGLGSGDKDGGDGGDSTFLTLSAKGGKGGEKKGGDAGTGGKATGGTINTDGDDGFKTNGQGGAGGNSGFGTGGAGQVSNGNGNPGTAAGGGGSGAKNGTGGTGGTGQVIISYTCPVSAGTLSGTQSICLGSTTTTFSSTVSGGTWSSDKVTIATVNATTGVITGVAAGTATISYTVGGSGGCAVITSIRTITVNTIPTKPEIVTTTQPTCSVSTGSVTLNNLPSGNWTLTRSGSSTATTIGTGTSTTVSGLAVGKYTFTVNNGNCTSTESNKVTIEKAVILTNTWKSSWSLGNPTLDQDIVFDEDYNLDADVNGCSCKVSGNKNVVIKSGRTMKIVNDIKISGTLTFEDTASLVQINDTDENKGSITYKRNTASVLKTAYTYWSSPVSGFTLGGITKGTLYYSFDAATDSWVNGNESTTMETGMGYIVRGAGTWFDTGTTVTAASFFGAPNNGLKTIAVAANKSNLLGNPYPSAMSADTFLATNSGVLEGTLYFWTHNTNFQDRTNISDNSAGSGAYAYTSNDYATYNSTGGIATALAAEGSSVKPTGYIAAGQGFFATSTSAGTLKFNNAMRVGGTTLTDGTKINQQFFKTKNSKTVKVIEKNRVWLNLTNKEGAFKQTLIGYITDATNEYDNNFDGISLDGNDFIDFYSVNNDKNLTIQGRALPFDKNDEVPLGYSSTIEGEFTISIDEVDGALTNQAVYIEDKLTNTTFDLKSGNYNFTTTAGTFNDRFVLRYTSKTLGTNDYSLTENKVVVSNKNKQITVNSFSETIDKVTIYDLLGRQIYQKDKVNNNEFSVSNLNLSHQTLIVKTSLQNGSAVTNKVIY